MWSGLPDLAGFREDELDSPPMLLDFLAVRLSLLCFCNVLKILAVSMVVKSEHLLDLQGARPRRQ